MEQLFDELDRLYIAKNDILNNIQSTYDMATSRDSYTRAYAQKEISKLSAYLSQIDKKIEQTQYSLNAPRHKRSGGYSRKRKVVRKN